MPDDLQIESLIIDDSFANFCFRSNEEDILFWEGHIQMHPSQKEKIEEAIQIVLGLNFMFKEGHGENDNQSALSKTVTGQDNKLNVKRIIRYAATVAASVLIVLGIKNYLAQTGTDHNASENVLSEHSSAGATFSTARGDKKSLLLPDNSKLLLGAGSTLRIEEGFGKNNRSVYLNGEALFDVTHNSNLPFIVHCENYDVKVLGTLFNVKAYKEDQTSETSLMKGKVEISVKNIPQVITLNPNQKAIISKDGNGEGPAIARQTTSPPTEKITVAPISYNKDSIVIETAWTRDRLEIVNENFTDIKNKLERWYDIRIVFADEAVANYTFTATFKNETIEQVLDALQYSYHFTYKKEGNTVTISK